MLCHPFPSFFDYLSERIFLRSLFLPTGLIIDAFHYPFLPFGLAPFKDVLSLIVLELGLRFMKPKGEIYSASVPLDCFLFIMIFNEK